MTKKIIEKYERVLGSRENQIADLSSELGTVNDTFYSIQINIQYYIMKIFFSKINLWKKNNFYSRI